MLHPLGFMTAKIPCNGFQCLEGLFQTLEKGKGGDSKVWKRLPEGDAYEAESRQGNIQRMGGFQSCFLNRDLIGLSR